MMKHVESLKVEADLIEGLSTLLDRIPIVRLEGVTPNTRDPNMREIDAIVDVEVAGAPFHLLCEFKTDGHPPTHSHPGR